jgi:putative ABC transport system permease protein
MLAYKLLLVLNEGLIFGVLALGVYVSFQWLRFPDLTPDGSFVLGSVAYALAVLAGWPPVAALLPAILGGATAGACTAAVNRWFRVPTVVAGLLTASALYSVAWLLLGRPNQPLTASATLVGNAVGANGATRLLVWLLACLVAVMAGLVLFSRTMWGLRTRAIGENPLLARDLGTSETAYTFVGLGIGNGLVGLAGALFVQRSYSADINMGLGATIAGLAGMLLGLFLFTDRKKVPLIVAAVVAGAILYKALVFVTLEVGMPAASFRLVSAVFLLGTFALLRVQAIRVLGGLKWS